ncbi:DUF4362 domain-containing protein [uncultured Paenibacillus sp.]|uniref:DUF4362 domain-containing protein n=1 Tax=uncultured Paenibacillus sp. TaxID=227322 RepID=UPI0028D6C8BB|nr:DUF4362 domain-containing protein [uncultured Paenibacillus sp.]
MEVVSMYKKSLMPIMFVLVFLAAVGLAGCGAKESKGSTGSARSPEELEVKQWSGTDVQEVKVSRSKAFGRVNPALLGSFTDPAITRTFAEAILSAEKQSGVMDVIKPDYDLTFISDNTEQSFQLWLHPESDSGMYAYVEDTGTGYKLTEESAVALKRYVYGIEYRSEQAANNGDVVELLGKIMNADKWEQFLANIKSGSADEVQITSYTIEGDPIFYDLMFDGERIAYTYDSTFDAFGSRQKLDAFCTGIDGENTEQGIDFKLTGCQEGQKEAAATFRFMLPESNRY